MASAKSSLSKNVVYDSRNDVPTGKKRAVDFTGGVSVAERARLFGAQVTHSTAPKNPPVQRSTGNKPTNVIQPSRTYETPRNNPRQTYSSPERSQNYSRSRTTELDNRSKHESQYYSAFNRSPQRQRQPAPTYDTIPSKPRTQHSSKRANYSQIMPGEAYQMHNNYVVGGKPLPLNSNYFQPIQDPLEALYRQSTQGYSQEQIPLNMNLNYNNQTDGMHAFDLGNLINRIQEDYLSNVRPYVASVEFIENEQNSMNMDLINPSTGRQNYSRPINDIYLRPNQSYNYDIIDTSNLYQRYPRPIYQEIPRSSMRRKKRKHRKRYHDQASSPIHIFESSIRPKRRESTPPPPSPKPPTPVPTEPEEEEATVNTKTEEEAKTTEVETSSESEEEEEEEVVPPPKPVAEPPAPIPRPTPVISARPPAKPVATDSSDSDGSESDSDDDSDDDEEDEVKPTARPPIPRPTNVRTAPTTPQTNVRIPPLRGSTANSDDIHPVQDTGSARSFDLQTSKKSGGKLKSFFGRFRRRKS